MSVEIMNAISSGGAGVAVIVVTIIFLRFLRNEREVRVADRREERREFLQQLEQASGAVERVSRNVAHASSTMEQLTSLLLQRPCMWDAHIRRKRGAKGTSLQPEVDPAGATGEEPAEQKRPDPEVPEGY